MRNTCSVLCYKCLLNHLLCDYVASRVITSPPKATEHLVGQKCVSSGILDYDNVLIIILGNWCYRQRNQCVWGPPVSKIFESNTLVLKSQHLEGWIWIERLRRKWGWISIVIRSNHTNSTFIRSEIRNHNLRPECVQ